MSDGTEKIAGTSEGTISPPKDAERQRTIGTFKTMLCDRHNRWNEFMEPSGHWVLIRPNFKEGLIELAICHTLSKNEKRIVESFQGACAQDIYHHLFLHTKYITTLEHAAYIGKELKKAEIALALGIKDQYQE